MVIDPSLFRPLRLISPLFPRFRISVTVSGAQLRKRSFTADRTCEACSRQHDVRVPSREWSRRRRVSGGAAQSLRRYVPFPLPLSFLYLNDYSSIRRDWKRRETPYLTVLYVAIDIIGEETVVEI